MMNADLHTFHHLMIQNSEFEAYLRATGRSETVDDYYETLDEVEVEQASTDSDTNRIINLYLATHELAADINLLRDLAPENSEMKMVLGKIASKYATNALGGASMVFFTAIAMEKETMADALKSEHAGINISHGILRDDIARLSKNDGLVNAVSGDDRTIRMFVKGKLLPHIENLAQQIEGSLNALEHPSSHDILEDGVARIGSREPPPNPHEISKDSVVFGGNVVSIFSGRDKT